MINPESGAGEDAVHVGLAAFGLVLAQGVIVGIIFGIVTSKIKRLHISNKKKGAGLGLATGVIVYIVLFVAVTLTVYPSLLTSALTRYPQTTLFSLQGTQTHIMTGPGSYLFTILGYALFAYLVYGFILGGILVWAYSIYNFDLTKLIQLEKAETNKTKPNNDSKTLCYFGRNINERVVSKKRLKLSH